MSWGQVLLGSPSLRVQPGLRSVVTKPPEEKGEGAVGAASTAREAAERAPGPGLGREEPGSGVTSHEVCSKLINLQGPQDNGGKSASFRIGMGMTGSWASLAQCWAPSNKHSISLQTLGEGGRTVWRRVFLDRPSPSQGSQLSEPWAWNRSTQPEPLDQGQMGLIYL